MLCGDFLLSDFSRYNVRIFFNENSSLQLTSDRSNISSIFYMSQGAQIFTCNNKLMVIIEKKKLRSETGCTNNFDSKTFEPIKYFWSSSKLTFDF